MINKLLILLCVLFLTACVSVPNMKASSEPPPAPRTKVTSDYRIGATDILSISAWRNPDISVASAPVSPDGTISLPLVGNISVSGMTTEEAGKTVENAYLKYVKDPHITVSVVTSNSHEYLTNVRVGGAVRTPTSVPYHQGATVIDVVLHSGGPNDIADPNGTTIHRGTGVYKVKLGDILEGADMATNYPVYPGDIITVPEKTLPITTTTPFASIVPWFLLLLVL